MQSAAKSLSLTKVKLVARTNPPHLRSNSSSAVTLTPAFISNSAPKRVLKSVTVSLSSSSDSIDNPEKMQSFVKFCSASQFTRPLSNHESLLRGSRCRAHSYAHDFTFSYLIAQSDPLNSDAYQQRKKQLPHLTLPFPTAFSN